MAGTGMRVERYDQRQGLGMMMDLMTSTRRLLMKIPAIAEIEGNLDLRTTLAELVSLAKYNRTHR